MALANLKKITAAITDKVGLGIYECPHPYKRLLSDAIVSWCAQSGRYTFIKDTCCQIETIRRRLALTAGSRLHIANANGQTLLASLQAGAHGYSGVMTNFHPELYVWLCDNWQTEPEKALVVSDYLSTASLAEHLDYPICAKDYQKSIGNFRTVASRVREAGNYYAAHFQSNMLQLVQLGEIIKKQLGIVA